MTRKVVVGALLAGSLVGNVVQWQRGDVGDAEATARAPAPPSRPPASPSPSPLPRSAAADDQVDVARPCPAELARVANRLTEVEAELSERRRPSERFELGEPNPALRERVIDPFLAETFADAPERFSVSAECRGRVCALDVTYPERDFDYDWMAIIQAASNRQAFDGMAFRAATPAQDPVTKEAILVQRAFVHVADEDAASGAAVLRALLERFESSGAAARCEAEHPDAAGYLSLRIDLDGERRSIQVHAGGTLATEPAGRCLRAALDEAIAATEVPERVRGAVQFHAIELPRPTP